MAGTAEMRASVRLVFANPDLRRVQLAFFGSSLGDWAYATAVTVWAYSEGGAAAVGIFQALRFVAMAVAGPLGAVIADRVPRRPFMMTTDAIRAVLVSAAALCLGLDVPSIVVYALALLAVIVGAPFRAAQAGLIPSLSSSPEELTASNAVASNLENIVVFAGPAIGALMLGVVDVEAVFWLNVASYVWSLALLARVSVPPRERAERAVEAEGEDGEGFLSEVTAGFTTIGRDSDLRVVALLAAGQGWIWGSLTVFTVLISVRMLHAGAHGVGYLSATMGVGTVLGGLVILGRVGRGRVGQDMAVGVLGWSLPLLLLAAWPSPVTAVASLFVIGLMDPWVNLGLDTIPQRVAREQVLSRVFAAVDAALIGAMSLGAALTPVSIRLVGFRLSLVLLGVVVSTYAAWGLLRMKGLDRRLGAPEEVGLLRAIPMFATLSAQAVESLAHALEHRTVPAGTRIVVEGEPGEEFYVIAAGEVEVTQGDTVLRREGPGDHFGEIGLLRDVPRTATVTAVSETELLVLQRDDFLATVTGTTEARLAAEEIVSRRLGV